jgi:hypothetical protein
MPAPAYHNEPIPGIDGRWVCINRIAERLLERLCHGGDVICHLREALRRGLLRCQIGCDFRLIEPSEWGTVLELIWRDTPEGWFIDIVCCKTGAFLAASCHAWKPHADRLWPVELSSSDTASQLKLPLLPTPEAARGNGSLNAHEQRKAERAERKAARQAEKSRHIPEAMTWLKENMPSLKYAELREPKGSKKQDPFTRCKAKIQDLSFNEFKDAVKAERDRRRALEL